MSNLATNAPGWYPLAEKQSGFVAGKHYSTGNQGRRAVVLHIAEGGFLSSVSYLRQQGLSAHFMISEAGSVAQMVSVHDSAWGNGLSYKNGQWYSPDPRNKLVHPTWQRIEPGVNPNFTTISIEHAGYHDKPRPKAQIDATIALLKWLAGWFHDLVPYKPSYSLIGHGMLDTIDRVNCPGPYFDLAKIASAATPAASVYTFPGLPVYQSSMLIGSVALYLPKDTYLEIDQIGGPGYAPNAGHVKRAVIDGRDVLQPGFVDTRQLRNV